MSDPITIGRIGSIGVRSIRRTTRRNVKRVDIVGEYGSAFSLGVPAESYSLELQLTTQTQYHQLQEMVQNPLMDWDYITFPTMRSAYSGFYLIEENSSQEEPWHVNYFPFSVTITKLGSLGNLRLATFWYAHGAETYSWGGATLATTRMVSVPHGSTNIAWTATNRTASDGAIPILENPTREDITYTPSETISDWYLGECRIYDTVTTLSTNEAAWLRVYSPMHYFSGDCVIQNGLLRYRLERVNVTAGGIPRGLGSGDVTDTTGTFSVYDTTQWVTLGQFNTALTGNLNANIKQLQITSLTSEEISWREIRQNGINPIVVEYLLRKGAYHCRVSLATKSLGIDTGSYVQIAKAGGFTQLFNSSSNGAAGAGNLDLDASNSYECGYNVTDNIFGGFVLLNQPVKQPYDPGASGNYLPLSLTWAAGTTYVFFVLGFPQSTGSFNLTTGRSNAASVAAQARYYVRQKLILPERGYY